ncbi:unnamed protein product [Ilex paraguariensis]|uniref:Annexin n=1 Tax=Ilex paraguariensis TaxID=185542 RepID=A0ABC8UJ29_9AQUA
MATKITISPILSSENVCKEIHDSWGSLNHLVPSLASLSGLQRKQIREEYMTMYGEDLLLHLRNTHRNQTEVSAEICAAAALSMLILNPNERDAIVSREALEQSDINYKALIEIFVGRKSSHVALIQQAYQTRFRRLLDQDIITIEPPNPYKKILMALAASHKAHHADVSQHIAKCDARRLYQTGEGRSGAVDESVVLEILSKRSISQLKQTFSCYKLIYGHNYTKSFKTDNHGEFGEALKTVVKCIYNPPKYYAKVINIVCKFKGQNYR